MAQPAPASPKTNTKSTQAWNASSLGVHRRPARGNSRVRGEARESARGRAVIELDAGITVYPPQENGGRWRAIWIEDGRRRYCEAVTEAKLAKGWRRLPSGSRPTHRAWNGPEPT